MRSAPFSLACPLLWFAAVLPASIPWTWCPPHASITGFLPPARCVHQTPSWSSSVHEWLSDAGCLSLQKFLQLCFTKMGPSWGRFQHGDYPWGALYTAGILIVVGLLGGPPRSDGEMAIRLPFYPLSSGYRCYKAKYFSDSPVFEMSCRFGHSAAQDLDDGSVA